MSVDTGNSYMKTLSASQPNNNTVEATHVYRQAAISFVHPNRYFDIMISASTQQATGRWTGHWFPSKGIDWVNTKKQNSGNRWYSHPTLHQRIDAPQDSRAPGEVQRDSMLRRRNSL